MADSTRRKRAKRKSSLTGKNNLFYVILLLAAATALIFIGINYNLGDIDTRHFVDPRAESYSSNLKDASKPFNGTHFIQPPDDSSSTGARRLWGSLNSGQYFGLKMSSPKSIEYGTMWFANQLNKNFKLDIRHLCDQNDKLKFYAWTRHDFYSFGEQIIQDKVHQLKTSYQIHPDNRLNWDARITFDHLTNDTKVKPISLIQYVIADQKSDRLDIAGVEPFLIDGYSEELSNFTLSIKFNSTSAKPIRVNYLEDYVQANYFTLSSFVGSKLRSNFLGSQRLFELSSERDDFNSFGGNFLQNSRIIVYQIILDSPGSLLIEFRQKNAPSKPIDYETSLANRAAEFDGEFEKKFKLDFTSFGKVSQHEVNRLAKVALSNMIGGVGYFYGTSYINSPTNVNKVIPYGPIELLTAVPSRSFFPRGFLWDEGFHNILISHWNSTLSNSIIKSWFNIMNMYGWMPREVILGIESIRRVPEEFVVQSITNANPPSMFLPIERMFDDGSLEDSVLENIYPRLKAWFEWFNVTQSGIKPSTYRWRGRDELSVNMLNPKTLTSGLDDYPRSSHPSPDEYHIDLRCWMARSARALAKLSKKMKDMEYHEHISEFADYLQDNKLLDELHWSDENRMYCDYGYNTLMAELVRVTKKRQSSRHPNLQETYQVLERSTGGQPKYGCVPEFGYVSLFPMLFNIVDHRSEKLGIMLDRMRDEKELWSPYGIRSLSASSRYYNKDNTEHDKPYWRGAVWLNVNYLILSSLKFYSKLAGPNQEKCSQLFTELKANLANNVMREFSRTNYIWESYDDVKGNGKGSHPFTGWSSLILLIMSSNLDE